MNKKIIKWSIIVLSIITVVILIILNMLTSEIKNKKEIEEEPISPEEEIIVDKNGEIINNFNEYSTIKSCINTLLTYTVAKNEKAINEISGEKYIFEGQNILQAGTVILNPIHRINNGEGSVNFVSFKIYKQAPTYYGIVMLDYENKTFKIIKSTETEYKNAMQKKVDAKYQEYIKIEPQTFNKWTYSNINEENRIEQYFRDYIQKALYYPEEAYNSLDEEYRNKKFKTIEEYKNYVQKNRKKLESLDIYSMKSSEDFATDEEYENYINNYGFKGIDKYLIKGYDNYKMYTCIDDYGNYYIFKITGAMQYTIYLDDYTVALPEFIQKYNSSTKEEKATLNLDRFLKAIKEEDYVYAYDKLSQGFKQNYFKTEQIFEQYVKRNWIDYNTIDKVEVQEKSDILICTLITTKGETKQFNIQLDKETEYQISFKI